MILLRTRILKITTYQNSTKTLQNKKKHIHTHENIAKKQPTKQNSFSYYYIKLKHKITQKTNMVHFKCMQLYSRRDNGTPLQYSCLENPMDGGAWWAAVHGVAKSWTQLSDFTLTFHFHALEKEMATHSSVPAWRIPGTGEPGGLLSMGSHRVGHD